MSRKKMCRQKGWCFAILFLCMGYSALAITPAILDDTYGYMLPGPTNISVWWCEGTYKVGRNRALPAVADTAVYIQAARNEYEPFQVVLNPAITLSNLTVTVSDFVQNGSGAVISLTNLEVCLVEYVPVTNRSDYFGTEGDWPDPLIPIANTSLLAGLNHLQPGRNQPVWFTVYIPKTALAGDYDATVTFSADSTPSFEVPIQLHVFDFTLSDVTHTRTAYHVYTHAGWHKPATLEQSRYIFDLYMENFRKHRVAPEAAHYYHPIVWSLSGGEFTFNFNDFDSAMTRYLDEFDFNGFTVFGRRVNDIQFPKTLGGYAAFTPQYNVLLRKFLDPVMAHLRELGWQDKAFLYWADEPSGTNFVTVFSGMDALQAAAPDLPRMVSLNNLPTQYIDQAVGRVDLWVPVMSLHDTTTQLKTRRVPGEEMWWYGAVGPPAPWPTYFIDHPAMNHRLRFWAAEKYNVSGDLYYSVNQWNENPWLVTRMWSWALQNGDGVLLYPPARSVPSGPLLAGPINSIRWEMVREAMEDGEYFWWLKQGVSNACLRLGPGSAEVQESYAARTAALSLITNMTAYSMDPIALHTVRERMARAIEGIDNGAPLFVKQPSSKLALSGSAVTLRAEAIGWPPPQYQWKLNGTNISGATGSFLTLTNFSPIQAGLYTVIATNIVGKATGDTVRVEGNWANAPSVLRNPDPFVQYAGERAVLSVTAVSSNALGYLWLKDGAPVMGAEATRSTLLLTNLTAATAGYYSVVISNSYGSVTSTPSRLIVLWNPTNEVLSAPGSLWRYNDTAQDLGAAWREPGYDDSSWLSGLAQLGFGNGTESTQLSSSPAPATVYFRKELVFSAGVPSSPISGSLRLDGGAVVYVNGTEVFRTNLPSGVINYATSALAPVEGAAETVWSSFSLPSQYLRAGTNVVAVEVHQFTGTSGLTAFWKFDESGSPWQDSAGTHHFSAVGAGVSSITGRVSGAVTNASGVSWLQASDAEDLRYGGPFTVGGWFAYGGPAANYPEVSCLEKAGEFRLYYTGQAVNRFRFRVGNTEVQEGTGGAAYGIWRFLIAWYDGTNASVQLNGGPVYTATAAPPAPTTNPVVTLKSAGAGTPFMADEVFFFRRALSASERTSIYTNGLRLLVNPPMNDLGFDLQSAVQIVQAPEFVEQPSGLNRYEGQSAALRAVAVSSTNVSYQWNYNGQAIAGETNAVLFLPGLTQENAGSYTLIATSRGGSSTTYPAVLNVLNRPELRARGVSDGAGISLTVPASDATWHLLYSTNLIDWRVLTTVTPGAQEAIVVDGSIATNDVGFYRLQME